MFLPETDRNYQSPFTDLFSLDPKMHLIFLAFWVLGDGVEFWQGSSAWLSFPVSSSFHVMGVASIIM